MKVLLYSSLLLNSLIVIAQNKDIELLKAENGNIITYYAKSNVKDAMTVEFSVEGSGFTTDVQMPVSADLKPFEKKELVKITMDASGNSSFSISMKQFKTLAKSGSGGFPANPATPASANRADLSKGIVVFTKDGCGKCTFTKNFLAQKGKPFKEINISKNEADEQLMWDKLKEAGFNGGSVQTPVIMVDGKVNYNMDLNNFLAELK